MPLIVIDGIDRLPCQPLVNQRVIDQVLSKGLSNSNETKEFKTCVTNSSAQLKDGWRISIGQADARLQPAAKMLELQRITAHRIDPFTTQRRHQVDRLLQ